MDQGGEGRPIISAGGAVVIRRTEVGARVAVLESGGLVSLPRAEVGPGESAETAARRAASAFVGDEVRLGRTLGQSREAAPDGEVLTWFWLAASAARGLDPAAGGAAPPPGYDLHWMDLEEAALSLESEEEAALLEELRAGDLRPRRSPLASAERRGLDAALAGLRDASLPGPAVDPTTDPEEALAAARLELARSEERLTRGDLEGARRAQARAARAGLVALDGPGRRVEFARLRRALPEELRRSLDPGDLDALSLVPGRGPGEAPSLEALLTLHDAVESEATRRGRARATRRAHEVRAALALLSSVGAAVALALLAPGQLEAERAWAFALQFAAFAALGGWAGGALRRTRGRGLWRRAAALEAAAGAAAGLAAGAALTAGFAHLPGQGHLTFVLGAVYAAGWFGGARLGAGPSGSEVDPGRSPGDARR